MFQTWELQSTNGQAITLTFDSLNIEVGLGLCTDWVEINDGSSTKRYCGPYYGNYYYDNGDDLESLGTSIPGPFTSTTTITVEFRSSDLSFWIYDLYTKIGFLAVVCCSAHVTTTDLTSGKLINIYLDITKSLHS